jgi:chromosomal replication initiation ATPase DnaA
MDRIDRLHEVVRVVGDHFGVPDVDMRSSRRTTWLHRPRCIAVYLADRVSGSTRAEIGAAFGRDPAVIAMYCKAIERELSESSERQRLLRGLERTVKRHWRMT